MEHNCIWGRHLFQKAIINKHVHYPLLHSMLASYKTLIRQDCSRGKRVNAVNAEGNAWLIQTADSFFSTHISLTTENDPVHCQMVIIWGTSNIEMIWHSWTSNADTKIMNLLHQLPVLPQKHYMIQIWCWNTELSIYFHHEPF